ncbi:tripartite tricarboxylate transporter substrate binding protein [Acidovorax sacchari]|uniref:tripartite tricarboxylate transporter substrate binding protein n=1 Tax=Acidovorax sacchari TaxID=3230736 RepID=UPI0039E28769
MPPRITRRAALAATLATPLALSLAPLQPARAQSAKDGYPARPVKVVVPFVPGGNADSTARIFAEAYAQRLGQPFVIDNRGGASGMIGALQVVRSEPDGYTLLMGTTAPIVSSWQLAGKAAYGLKDMKAVALLTLVPGVLVVNAESSFKTYQDFVAHARAHPGEVRIGHPGNGTAGHVNILQIQKALGTPFVIAGYKGAGPAVQDLLGRQLDAVATDLPSALQLVKGGKLRALGVVFPQRVPSLPDVPTMAEARQPEVDIAPFTAVMAPRNVPQAIVDRIVATNDAVLADAATRKRVEDIGGVPTRMATADFEQFLARHAATYAALIHSGLLTAD